MDFPRFTGSARRRLQRTFAVAGALFSCGIGHGGVIAVDGAVPAVMNAGGSEADPAIYRVGVAPGVVMDLTGSPGYLGQTTPYNRLVVENAAKLSVRLRVGDGSAAIGNSILVSGANTRLTVFQFSFFGLAAGQNRLRVEKGGRMIAGDSWLGYNASSNDNAAVISGQGSGWELSTLGVGSNGSRNSVGIEDGAEVVAHTMAVGSFSTAIGNHVTVDGTGSRLSVAQQVYLGSSGRDNRMEIVRGGSLSAAGVLIGNEAVASGNQLLADGSGSRLQIADIRVGGIHSPSNALVIRNRAEALGTSCRMGEYDASDFNQLRIEGAGSSFQLTGDLTIGVRGDENVFRISAGGVARNHHARLGTGQEGNPNFGMSLGNRAVIEDFGSKWVIGGDLSIGEYGIGNTVEIRAGGLVVVEGGMEIDRLRRGGNRLLLDGGFLAWKGDQTAHAGRFLGLVTDRRATETGAFGYQYFATDGDALAATGYPGLGGYTVLGTGSPRIPAAVNDWRLRIPHPLDDTGDEFPSSLDVLGKYALVGATKASFSVGSAFLIDLESGATVRQFASPPVTPGNRPEFGNSVALTDQHAVVAAYRRDHPGASFAGAVYVFDRATGTLLHDLRPRDQAAGQRFGTSVSAQGNLVLIGASGDRSGAGAGYLFDLVSGTQLAKLTDASGTSVSMGGQVVLEGTLAVITAARNGSSGVSDGQLWLFDVTDPRLPSAGTSLIHPRAAEPGFRESTGFASLALENGLLVAGSPGERGPAGESSAGAAYLIDVSHRETPRVLKRITSPEPAAFDHFGDSVGISGKLAVISNAFIDRPEFNVGEVRVLDLTDPAEPVDLGAIAAPPEQYTFGIFVAIDGARVVAGTRSSSGSVVGAIHSHVLPDPRVAATTSAVTTREKSVTHTVTVSNPGPVDITELELELDFKVTATGSIVPGVVNVTSGRIEGGKWILPRIAASQTAVLSVTYTADRDPGTGGTLVTTARIAGSREFLTGRQDDAATVESRIVGVVMPEVVTLDAHPVIDRQTGLLVHRVTITNRSAFDLDGWWLTVAGLPANVEVRNATGLDDAGRAILTGQPLAAGAAVTLSVEFYSPLRDPGLTPVYGIGQAEPVVEAAAEVVTPPVEELPGVERLPDGTVSVGFGAVAGRVYRIEYSRDLIHWRAAGPPLIATSDRLQWIDRGPPETESVPSSVPSRFYRAVPLEGNP